MINFYYTIIPMVYNNTHKHLVFRLANTSTCFSYYPYYFLVFTGYSKLREYLVLKPTYLGMLNGSLTTSMTFHKFYFLNHLQTTSNNFVISGSPRPMKP